MVAYHIRILIFLIFIFNTSLQAHPTIFDRLVLTDANGNLIKTVDLIGDFHIAIPSLVKRASRRQSSLLKPEEKYSFSTTERTFLIALRQLNKRPGKIDLLWELSEWLDYHSPLAEMLKDTFISYGGFIAAQEFKKNNGSIRFYDTDTYRDMIGSHGSYVGAISSAYVSPNDISLVNQFHIRSLKVALEKVISAISKDIDIMKKTLSPAMYQKITEQASNYTNKLQKIITEIIDPALKKDPELESFEFLKTLPKDQLRFLNDTTSDLADLEMLMKILSSNTSHLILYAGAAHVESLEETLPIFGYQTEIAIKRFPAVPLSHRIWQIVLESPEITFRKYKERHRRPLIFQDTRSDEFDEFFEEIEEIESVEQENNFIEKLDTFLKASGPQYYYNFLEGRSDEETLLFYAVKNNRMAIVKFLVDHGARINTPNDDGNTPLHLAAKLSNPEIFLFLLSRGGDSNYKNNEDYNALYYAGNSNWDESVWKKIWQIKAKKIQQKKQQELKKAQVKRKAPEITSTTTTTITTQTMEPGQKIQR